jgi:signal transduction histidine kinase
MILGAAEVLQDATSVDECRRFGNEIIEHCRKISSTVTNLSQYARPGSMHDTQTVDLNDVVEAAIESVHRTQLSDAVDIVWTRLPVAKVLGKPDELQQALFNVIRNAVQACGKHGVIRIGLEEHGDSVDVLVRDNGPAARFSIRSSPPRVPTTAKVWASTSCARSCCGTAAISRLQAGRERRLR